jgi:hypothetical protein
VERSERQRADALDQYWDAVQRGERPRQSEVDEVTVAVIRHLSEAGSTSELETAQQRVRHRIVGSAKAMEATMHTAALSTDWLDTPPSWPEPAQRRRLLARRDRVGWPLTQLATAALVLLTLVAGYVAFGGPLRPRQQDTRLAAIPAIVATPDGSPSPGVLQDTILFQQRIEVIPDRAGWTGVERYPFAPGETWTFGAVGGATHGPMLYRLEAGTMTVRAAAPFLLTRAGASAANEAPQETDIVLAPGDVAFLPYGVAAEWRNDGTAPAQVLAAGIALWGMQTKPTQYYYNVYPSDWPPAPVEFTLRLLTLPPGGHLPIAAGLAYVGLESGRLTIVWIDPASPTAAPKEQQVGTPGTPVASDARYPIELRPSGASRVAQELRNDSAAPVTFLVWTITPVGESAPQPATPMP